MEGTRRSLLLINKRKHNLFLLIVKRNCCGAQKPLWYAKTSRCHLFEPVFMMKPCQKRSSLDRRVPHLFAVQKEGSASIHIHQLICPEGSLTSRFRARLGSQRTFSFTSQYRYVIVMASCSASWLSLPPFS